MCTKVKKRISPKKSKRARHGKLLHEIFGISLDPIGLIEASYRIQSFQGLTKLDNEVILSHLFPLTFLRTHRSDLSHFCEFRASVEWKNENPTIPLPKSSKYPIITIYPKIIQLMGPLRMELITKSSVPLPENQNFSKMA